MLGPEHPLTVNIISGYSITITRAITAYFTEVGKGHQHVMHTQKELLNLL
jgi:hypothetical protein